MFKRTIFILLISLFIHSKGNSQPTFYSTHSAANRGREYAQSSVITMMKDGSFMGLSNDSSSSTLYSIYKFDVNGDVQWRKQFLLPEICIGVKAATLSDSSVAFLFATNNTLYDMIVMKVSPQGSVLWCNGYGPTTSFLNILVPTTNGGMVISGAGCIGFDLDIRLDNNGNIVSQKSHNGMFGHMSLNPIDMIDEGNNNFFKTALDSDYPIGNWPLVCYSVDANGESSNMKVITLAGGGLSSMSSIPNKLMAKASTKGYYVLYGLQPGAGYAKDNVLFYFDDHRNLMWAKKIVAPGIEVTPRFVTTDSDDGCLVTLECMLQQFNVRVPLYIQFDNLGNMLWSKAPGDIQNPDWSSIEATSVVRTTNDHIVSLLTRNFMFEFSQADKNLNGFCNYTSLTPIVSDLNFSVTYDSVFSHSVNFNRTAINLTLTDIETIRTDQCFSVNVGEINENEEALVYPNPARDELNIPENISSFEVFDITGAKVLSVEEPSVKLDVSALGNGIYLVVLKTGSKSTFTKVIISR